MRLDKVFRSHLAAERMNEDDVLALFNPPPGFARCLEPTNQILLGPKGSGKSIALRWLGFLPDRPPHDKPEFYGLMIPIGRYQFDYFRQAYIRTADDRPFLGYLNFYLLDRILSDLQRPHWKDGSGLRLPSSYVRAVTGFTERLSENRMVDIDDITSVRGVVADIQEVFKSNVEIGEIGPGILSPICSIENTISLLQAFAESTGQRFSQDRLALLLDGLDHLGDLGRTLAPLLSKDEPHSERLIVKAACRVLPSYLYANTPSVILEEGRDYSIIPCGVDDDPSEFQEHLRSVMENRLKTYGEAAHTNEPADIAFILPEKADRPYVGFRNLALLSGGNILTFLECCALALTEEEDKRRGIRVNVISPESQSKAVKHQSETYLLRDLNDQAGSLASKIRKYLGGFAAAVMKQEQHERGLTIDVDISSFTGDAASWKEFKDVMSVACELRYLVVEPARFVRIVRRDDPFDLKELRLSHTQAAYFDIPLVSGTPAAVGRDEITASQGLGHKSAPKETELFPVGPYIFVSIPGDEWGNRVHSRIRAALRDLEKHLGRGQEKKVLDTMTYQQVSEKREGKYVDNLVEAISKSTYVVFDVTSGITKGVMVEIGIAGGLRKPHALIWLADEPMTTDGSPLPFSDGILPPEVKRTDIKIRTLSQKKKGEAFYKWFNRLVHKQNHALSQMCGFQGSGLNCECEKIVRNPNKVYLRVQARNDSLKNKIIEELQRRSIEVIVADKHDSPTSPDACKLLREAGGAIFDISRGYADQRRYTGNSDEILPLLEIGYALGSTLKHSCVYMSDQGQIPSPMLGERITSIPSEGFERAVQQFVDYFVTQQLYREVRP